MTETAAVSFLLVVVDNSGGQDTSWPWIRPSACGDGACGPAPWPYCRNKSKRRKRHRLTKYARRWKNLRPCTCCPPRAERSMDSKLWSTLPSDLVQKVLERLPAPNQVQAQTVCKEWRSLLTDPLFLQESALSALGQSVCLVWQGVQTDLDPTQRHHLPHIGSGASRPSGADVLPHLKKLKLDPNLPSVDGAHVQCEGWFATHLFQQNVDEMKRRKELGQVTYHHVWENGLLCMWCCDRSTRPHGLYICLVNPVNRTWMNLPCLATISQTIRIIVVPGTGSEFRVMVRSMKCPRASDDHGLNCENCRYWLFNVYCSRSGAWSETTSTEHKLDRGNDEASWHLDADPHVFANGMLYATCGKTFDIGSKLIVLSGEDGQVVKEATQLENEESQGKLQSYGVERLVEHEGDIYCVANNLLNCSCPIQKLDECNGVWDFLSSYNLYRIINCQDPATDLVSAVVVGNSIYATTPYECSEEDSEPCSTGVILLSYDIEDGTWRSVSIDNMVSNCTLFAPRPDLFLPRQI